MDGTGNDKDVCGSWDNSNSNCSSNSSTYSSVKISKSDEVCNNKGEDGGKNMTPICTHYRRLVANNCQ